jgi:hypothetical protein
MFATKPELAGQLLQHTRDRGVRAAFVAGDEVYGRPDLRRSIHERDTGYVMAVRSNHAVTLPSDRRVTVKKAANLLKPAMWQRMRTGSASGSSAGPSSPNPAATSPTATSGPYGDAATRTTPSKPTSAGTPTPTSCHSGNDLQLP